MLWDDQNVYINDALVLHADAATMEYISTESEIDYFKDARQTYERKEQYRDGADLPHYAITPIPGAVPDQFYLGYDSKGKNVYWYGVKIDSADGESIEFLDPHYAKDKDNVYRTGKMCPSPGFQIDRLSTLNY